MSPEPWPLARPLAWDHAWHHALYGPDGFYRRPGTPARHFRTAPVAAGPVLAAALARLADRAGCTTVVDVGAGGGELLAALHAADPALGLTGVDVAPRPDDLPDRIGWVQEPPAPSGPTLLLGWELLDVRPCPVLEADADGVLREVLVAADGTEQLAGPAAADELAWADRWWPGPFLPGERVEIGAPRDSFWHSLVEHVVGGDGLALAVDYDHLAATRPRAGTLSGYRDGRLTAPVPDGRHDLTAHVALDAVAAGLPGSVLVRQRVALRHLGVHAARPDPALAGSDPAAYLAALVGVSAEAELLDRGGLGAFGWLLTPRGPRAADAARDLAG